MTAAVIDRYGPPETIALRQVPIPAPAAGEIRVRVRAATANRTDTATLRGYPFFARAMTGLLQPKMAILGMDFAGEVDALGEAVTAFQPGDRVFGLLPFTYGAHAQYVCLPATGAVAPIPDTLPFDEAVVAEGAWYASSTTDRLNPGQRCLVYGASGAIGTAAVQLAKARGAEVTAVVGTRHLELAASLGADHVVNYETQDFTRLGQDFDLVFDAVGKSSWFACRPLIKPGGLFAATDLGPYWSNIWLGGWYSLTGSRRVSVPFPEDAPGFVRSLSALMAQGKFRGVFDRTYPLADIVEAFRYVEQGQKTGIVRIDIP
ncbi:MAG: NAD(P)-dependent alcohol dehydrogenase [Roseivivax sp.]|nr:NAD(P)-dependent alcohol dehydrogenase [Roseivivax sp.]